MCNALVYLESQNVLHKDLALRNMLLNIDENSKIQVKLSDFGMSRQTMQGIYSTLKDQLTIACNSSF